MKDIQRCSKNDLIKVLAAIIMSDGSLSRSGASIAICLATSIRNKCQHDMFRFICERVFDKTPRRDICFCKGKKILRSRVVGKEYVKALLKLSPTYKTSSGQKIKPSLKFLLETKDKKIKILGLRTYFDFDGSIVPSFKLKRKRVKSGNKVYKSYQVQFECDINISETNPTLVTDLMRICNTLGIKAGIKKDKRNWSGLYGIRISNLKQVKRFIEFGGPITKVRVSSKSKRLKGITKSVICKAVLSLMHKETRFSYHFKDYKQALKKKEELNKKLIEDIKKQRSRL